MNYSVSAGSGIKCLKQADEIKIPYNKISEIKNYIDSYPDIAFVITIDDRSDEVNYKLLNELNNTINLTIELITLTKALDYTKQNLKWFWKYPIQTFYDLEGLIQLGASQVLIDAPLFFDLKKIKEYNIKVRLIVNQCYQNYIPRANGIHGCWILPQHMYLYEDYIYMIEFTSINTIQLNKLLDVYKNQKQWIEDCNVLFKYFNYHILGSAVSEDLTKIRLNCGQRCTRGKCDVCDKYLALGRQMTSDLVTNIKERLK